jgi:ubiquinone/menaquinone biosynthesis C-methylase UbiE
MGNKQPSENGTAENSHVCPPGRVQTFDNFLRPLVHNTEKLYGAYVKPGMQVMDVGCGAGFSSLAMARMVGEAGRVFAVDLQQDMLNMVSSRAAKAGVSDRIRLHKCRADSIGLDERTDFAVAFWMVHETPDQKGFLREILNILNPGGRFFIAEPKIHVTGKKFQKTIAAAKEIGYTIVDRPKVFFSHAVVLGREK